MSLSNLSSPVTRFAPLNPGHPTCKPIISSVDGPQRLLRFPLGEDRALLPLTHVTEVFSVSLGEVLPIPEMPGCVLGIVHWRGEMLWLIDLNDLVGYPSSLPLEQVGMPLMVIVLQNHHQAIGLGVSQVDDIESHELEQLQPVTPGVFPPSLSPFVQGTLPGTTGAVLDAIAITQCPLWQSNRGGSI